MDIHNQQKVVTVSPIVAMAHKKRIIVRGIVSVLEGDGQGVPPHLDIWFGLLSSGILAEYKDREPVSSRYWKDPNHVPELDLYPATVKPSELTERAGGRLIKIWKEDLNFLNSDSDIAIVCLKNKEPGHVHEYNPRLIPQYAQLQTLFMHLMRVNELKTANIQNTQMYEFYNRFNAFYQTQRRKLEQMLDISFA